MKIAALIVSAAFLTGCATGTMENMGFSGNPITHGIDSEKIEAVTEIFTLALIVRGYTAAEADDMVDAFIVRHYDAIARVRSLVALTTLIRQLVTVEHDALGVGVE
jgi:hypothetical protein